MSGSVRRVAVLAVGGSLVLIGAVLMILPGPGLLIVLGGTLLLATEFRFAARLLAPVRDHALWAAEQGVSSPLRLGLSVVGGLGLVIVGIVWGVFPDLPFGGWAAGVGLIVSGVVLLALLPVTHRRVTRRRGYRGSSAPRRG